jgi:regulator of sigma E protease
MFLLFEVITGKRVSDSFMERAVTFGFMLMLGLTIYANGLDAFRFLQK